MMKFFNTLTRRKEGFIPLEKGKVGIYSCGPTVYNFSHVGNLSTFVFSDLLKRYLLYRGYQVLHVMNITDVDDKTINGARKMGISLKKYTKKYTRAFLKDLDTLNIIPANVFPMATEHIPEIISLIKILMRKGFAYSKDGSVYYRISAFKNYGKLAALDVKNMKIGASGINVDEYTKDDVNDFALWKSYKPEEDGKNFWETEIGKGRPGWHIECSAMSMKYLGETFDIHTGGVDLIFPHHQNEIAQSEAATGKQLARYWLHREHLKLGGGEKMSKSVGNFKVLSDIVKEKIDALAFRYLVVSTHYRSSITFTPKTLESAHNTVVRLIGFRFKLTKVNHRGANDIQTLIDDVRKKFIERMDDDLNTPNALAVIFNLVKEVEKRMSEGSLKITSAKAVGDFLTEINQILGVMPEEFSSEAETSQSLSEKQLRLVREREDARKQRNWQRADEIRKTLQSQGIQLKDTVTGTEWSSNKSG